jgi:hypothetical protein
MVWLTLKEAAVRADCTAANLRKAIYRDTLKAVEHQGAYGKEWRTTEIWLREWMAKRTDLVRAGRKLAEGKS